MDIPKFMFTLASWVPLVFTLLIILVPIWFCRKSKLYDERLKTIETKIDDLNKKLPN